MVAEAEGEPGLEGFGRDIQQLAAYFYVDGSLLDSSQVVRIQNDFNVLMDLFDRSGLCKNVRNMASMPYKPCHSIGVHSTEAYDLRMMGYGMVHMARLRQKF